MLDPSNTAILEEFAIWTSLEDTDVEFWRTRLEQNRKYITGGITYVENAKGSLEIGYLPFIPSFGLIFVNPASEHGFCAVEIYHHKTDKPEPAFDIDKSDDSVWFEFFLEQYNLLWKSCRVETIPTGTNLDHSNTVEK